MFLSTRLTAMQRPLMLSSRWSQGKAAALANQRSLFKMNPSAAIFSQQRMAPMRMFSSGGKEDGADSGIWTGKLNWTE